MIKRCLIIFSKFEKSLPKKCSFSIAIGYTERYCFKKWPCKVCGLEHNKLKHHGTTYSVSDDTLGGMFQRNLNQNSKYSASSCFNVENIRETDHPEGLSIFEFDFCCTNCTVLIRLIVKTIQRSPIRLLI